MTTRLIRREVRVTRVYREPAAASRDDLERARTDRDVPKMREAVIALALAETDRRWMERQLIELMQDADGSVRSTAALAVGHLARVHRQIDVTEILPALERLLEDDEAGGVVRSARRRYGGPSDLRSL